MTARAALLAAAFERAAGKRVIGYHSGTGRVVAVGRDGGVRPGGWTAAQVGGEIDRINVEGESEWTLLPKTPPRPAARGSSTGSATSRPRTAATPASRPSAAAAGSGPRSG